MAAVDGILLMLWKGAPVPCFCCTCAPVPSPSGISCLDLGRQVDVARMQMQEMMELTASDKALELSNMLDKKFGGVQTKAGNKGSVDQA